MNEKKQKIVKNMLNVSMAVFVLYIVLGLVICLQPKIFLKSMLGYGEIILENSVLNFYQIGEFIVIGIVFILLWFLSKKKIFEHSSKSTILGVLNTIMAVSVCVVIPFIITLLSHSYGYAVIFPQSETEYAFFTGISELHFEKGIPTAVDGKEMGAVELVEYLNKVGGENGIGLLDIVENRLVGMKSRGVYETPGGAILYKAINVLETITLDKESAHFKAQLAQKYADIVYNGQWFTPLREALDAFADSLEKTVTGDVKLKLYKGNMINAGVTSPYTLYDEQTASFGEDEDYNQADAAGFINLFGLSIKERAKLSKNWPEVKE